MFDRIDTWIFDLDNTLYHPSARLFDQINARMTEFIMRELGTTRVEADRMRRAYWERHGTTLGGLMAEHGVDAARFLDEVHAIDLSALTPDHGLAQAIRRLPGRKLVHTNGARAHAARVLAACGLDAAFDAVYAIEDKGLVPKPRPGAYDRIVSLAEIEPARAAMIEDDARNLEVPKALGMRTIWLCHETGTPAPDWVDRRITRLSAFLDEVLGTAG